MATKVGIFNTALSHVGVEPVSSPTDVSKPAQICEQEYDGALEAALGMANWKFSKKRVDLQQLIDQPPFGYAFKYQLPADYIHLVEVSPKYAVYELESRELLTDETAIAISYIYKNDDPATYSPLFTEVLSLALAARVAMSLRQDKDLAQELRATAEHLAIDAKVRSARQDSNPIQEDPILDGWVRNRVG